MEAAPLQSGVMEQTPSSELIERAARKRRLGTLGSEAFRAFSGDNDGIRGITIDVYGPAAMLMVYEGVADPHLDIAGVGEAALDALRPAGVRAVYLKPFVKDRSRLGGALPEIVTQATPLAGEPLPPAILIREHDWTLEVRPYDGLSTGLFIDQRTNRAWVGQRVRGLLKARVARAPTVLNTFAYTCAFSVAAAVAGAATTSVDVSARYLEWGKRNFALNKLDAEYSRLGETGYPGAPLGERGYPAAPLGERGYPGDRGYPRQDQRFARMDTFEFLAYAQRKGLRYDIIILDPPSFGTGNKRKRIRPWSAKADFARLVAGAAALLEQGGVVLASTNTLELCRGDGLRREVVKGLGREPEWVTLPPMPGDFVGERGRFAACAFSLARGTRPRAPLRSQPRP